MEDQPSPESTCTCGECYYWVKFLAAKPINGSEPTPCNGLCWRYPPTVIPVQQKTALGQMQHGFINVRPTLAETERACGEFEQIDTPNLIESGYP